MPAVAIGSGLPALFVVPWRRIVASQWRERASLSFSIRYVVATGVLVEAGLSRSSIARSLLEVSEKSAGADHSTSNEATREAGRLSRLYLDALRAADAAGAFRVASRALEQGLTLPALYQRVITPAMHEIGTLWEKGAITVADEHVATAVTQQVLGGLRPPLGTDAADPVRGKGLALLAAVEGEQHVLGLRMAADVLEDVGYRAVYLGPDVPTGALLQSILTFSPDLLALSVTMPELARVQEEVFLGVRSEHPDLSLLVGGQSSRAGGGAIKVDDLESLAAEVASHRST